MKPISDNQLKHAAQVHILLSILRQSTPELTTVERCLADLSEFYAAKEYDFACLVKMELLIRHIEGLDYMKSIRTMPRASVIALVQSFAYRMMRLEKGDRLHSLYRSLYQSVSAYESDLDEADEHELLDSDHIYHNLFIYNPSADFLKLTSAEINEFVNYFRSLKEEKAA